MNLSLFSTLQLVARLLACDAEIHDLEKAWFTALLNCHGTTREQRKILRDELRGQRNKSIKELVSQIEEKDQARLLNFLKVAMHIDKKISPKETEFYQEIKYFIEQPVMVPSIDYTDYGRELLKRDKELALWQELGKMGDLMRSQRGMYYWFYPSNSFNLALLCSLLIELFLFKRKFFFVLITVLLILLVLLRYKL